MLLLCPLLERIMFWSNLKATRASGRRNVVNIELLHSHTSFRDNCHLQDHKKSVGEKYTETEKAVFSHDGHKSFLLVLPPHLHSVFPHLFWPFPVTSITQADNVVAVQHADMTRPAVVP